MRRSAALSVVAVLLGAVLLTGCATVVDIESMQKRVNGNEARIERLEKERPQAKAGIDDHLGKLEKDLMEVRKTFADSEAVREEILIRLEGLELHVQELEGNLLDLRKKGAIVDSALENLAGKFEAEVFEIGKKIRELLQQ